MKKLINFLIIIFLFANYTSAQTPADGSYVTNSNIDKFEGTWKWTSGADEITFQLVKVRHKILKHDEDVIIGCHEYIQSGTVLQTSLSQFSTLTTTHNNRTIFAWNDNSLGSDKIFGYFTDINRKKKLEVTMEYIPGTTPAQIMVTLDYKHQYLTRPDQATGMTLPATFTLTKQ